MIHSKGEKNNCNRQKIIGNIFKTLPESCWSTWKKRHGVVERALRMGRMEDPDSGTNSVTYYAILGNLPNSLHS